MPERSCRQCRHFNSAPLDVEAALPGLSSLSSAYAAVRCEDGLCAVHDRYVAASSICAAFSVNPQRNAGGDTFTGDTARGKRSDAREATRPTSG